VECIGRVKKRHLAVLKQLPATLKSVEVLDEAIAVFREATQEDPAAEDRTRCPFRRSGAYSIYVFTATGGDSGLRQWYDGRKTNRGFISADEARVLVDSMGSSGLGFDQRRSSFYARIDRAVGKHIDFGSCLWMKMGGRIASSLCTQSGPKSALTIGSGRKSFAQKTRVSRPW
jgi:hypothetical protein